MSAPAGAPARAVDAGAGADADADAGAHPHERWIVGIVTACVFATVTNTTMVNVALPVIGEQFDASAARLGWLVTVYALAFGVATPFYGRLGDRFGLRRMFVIGLSTFVVASLLAGLAPSFPALLALRMAQALGSAAIPSLGTAMIARVIPSARRGSALGIVSMAVGAGSALGPTLGGTLTQLVSWRMVFLASAALGLLIPFALRYLPRTGGAGRVAVDWLGGIALGAAIGGALLAVAGLQRAGVTSPLVLGAFAVATLALAATIWRHRTSEGPFIDRVLVANPRYRLLCLIGFCAMAGNIGALVIAPFLFKEINGLSSGETGLALLPSALAVALLSRTAGRLADRGNPFRLITTGLAISLATVGVIMTVAVGWPVVAFSALMIGLGIGQGLVNAPLSTTLTRTVPQRVYGSGLGIYNMLFFVGSGFGAALSTAVLDGRRDTPDALLPFYLGADGVHAYADAFIVSLSVFAVALVLARLAARASTGPASAD